MKALFITSATNETIKYAESFGVLPGFEQKSIRYTNRKPKKGGLVEVGLLDAEIIKAAEDYQPDLMVYIGSRWGELVAIENLQRLNAMAPMVHLCSDAADHPWWDMLEEYEAKRCFALQVAIDGNKRWPLHSHQRGLTALTPFDPRRYPVPKKHTDRPIKFGYGGNMGGKNAAEGARPEKVSERRKMIDHLRERGMQVRVREDEGTSQFTESYDRYIAFLARCRIMLNLPWSGTQQHMQVKGRVVEAALAGCALLEHKDAPTLDWFPMEDVIQYKDKWSATEAVRQHIDHPEETEAMGLRLREHVLREHGPEAFWGRILERIA